MTIYEIDQAILNCVDEETGEILDMNKLQQLEMERDKKIEQVCLWQKDLVAEAEAIQTEIKKLQERKAQAEKKAEGLKNYIGSMLEGQKFKRPTCSVSFRKTSSVEVPDVFALDENYLRYKDPEPDKKAIMAAIKAGQVVSGATLVMRQAVIIR